MFVGMRARSRSPRRNPQVSRRQAHDEHRYEHPPSYRGPECELLGRNFIRIAQAGKAMPKSQYPPLRPKPKA